MKKIYSIVLMAAALLIGTNVNAAYTVDTDGKAVIDNAADFIAAFGDATVKKLS